MEDRPAMPVLASTLVEVSSVAPGAAAATSDPTASLGGALPANMGRNVLVNYGAVVLTSVTALVTVPIMLALLGQEAYGVFVLVGSIVTYVQLFDLGFGAVTIKQVAANAGRDDDAVVRTLNTNFFALSLLGGTAALLGVAVAFVAPDLFDVPPDLRNATIVTVLILAVSLGVSIPFDILGGALAGYQRYDWLSISNVLLAVLSTVGAAVAVAIGLGLIGAAAAGAAVALSIHFLRFAMVRKLVPELRFSRRLAERSQLRSTTRESGWFLLRDITEVVINQADLIVVGIMLDLRAVAIYQVGLKLAQLSRRAMKPLSQIFFPQASSLAADQDHRRLALLLVDGTRISMLVATPILLILSLLAGPLLGAWGVGSSLGSGGIHDAVAVLVLLAIARGVTSVTETAWWLLAGAGWVRVTALVACVEAVVNLVASVLLARPLGPQGVALGTFIGLVGIGLPASLVLAGRLTGVPFWRLSREALLPHLVPTVVVGLALAGFAQVMSHNAVVVLSTAALAFLAYVALYLLLNGSVDESRRLRSALSQRRGRPRGRRRRESRVGV